MIPEIGIHPNISFDDYREWEAVNNSVLNVMRQKSPLHAKAYLDFPPEPSAAFIFGRIQHCLMLEPETFERDYVVAPKCDRRTKAGKELWAAFLKNADGKQVVDYEDYARMKEVIRAMQSQAVCRSLQGGEAELSFVWTDDKTGLLCKGRTDYAVRELAWLLDVKTTTDASPEGFAKSVANYGYAQQAAWYSDGWKALTSDVPAFIFVPVEKEYPFAAAAYEVADDDIQAGRNMYRPVLDRYAECVRTNTWPGYGDHCTLLEMPLWWRRQHGVSEHNLL